ncbi:MAG: hypothetical protein EBR02_10220, partial [Alphaproteobacteria bacterium]|nr:hypothetical protein [Alphaproteobacteria bacterium]
MLDQDQQSSFLSEILNFCRACGKYLTETSILRGFYMNVDRNLIEKLLITASNKIILPLFGTLKPDDIIQHPTVDHSALVTVADRDAELFLASELQKLHPSALIIGEEEYSQFASDTDKANYLKKI